MNVARIAELSRRGVVAVGGADARKFLNDLITAEIGRSDGGAGYGGLLTPQGKILFDFIVFGDGKRFLFDLPRNFVGDFIKRLGFYRLRAKVDIADLSSERSVVAAWGSAPAPAVDGVVAADPRLAALGFRGIAPKGAIMPADRQPASEADYDAHRIRLGVPEGGIDFAFGDAFPHDADMDQLGGVDFDKGCYVGQEVVSRMEHRGTARRRFILAEGGALPPRGADVTAGDRPIGTLGSTAGDIGLALVRLDRAKEAMDAGVPIKAAGTPVTLTLPPWARFGWPSTVEA
jgi:hypothetical protein